MSNIPPWNVGTSDSTKLYYHPTYAREIGDVLQMNNVRVQGSSTPATTGTQSNENDPEEDTYRLHYQGFLESIQVVIPKECCICTKLYHSQTITRALVNSNQLYLCTPCTHAWRSYKEEWLENNLQEKTPEVIEQLWKRWLDFIIIKDVYLARGLHTPFSP